jgi:hypothetical protein
MLANLLSNRERLLWLMSAALTLLWLAVYLTTVSPTVNFIDSGELITAVREPGIAHPPGYPLYVLLGYVASHVLWGEEAWRVNVLSAFWGALAVGAFFILIFRCSEYVLAERNVPGSYRLRASTRLDPRHASPQQRRKPDGRPPSIPRPPRPDRSLPVENGEARAGLKSEQSPGAQSNVGLLLLAASAAGASLLGASSTFWSRTAQAKMYSLHFFLVAVVLVLALGFRRAYERDDRRAATRWLIALAATLGLSFTNHLMTILLVIPVALMLLVGSDFNHRLTFIVRRLPFAAPAFLLPLLLYVYMPVRASQGPVMNWGSVDNWGDFWRHLTGWQFRPYLLGDLGGNLARNFDLVARYASQQWGFLSLVVILAGLAAGGLLLMARASLFWPTFAFLALTLIFSLFYGISEIEPYMTPFYAILAVWLGLAPASWTAISRRQARPAPRRAPSPRNTQPETAAAPDYGASWAMIALLAIVALGSAIVVYPVQNYSRNRLAEQFALNVFNELPQNSILFTDYWDFYAPTYYLQIVKGVRPDIAIIDKSLLRYPWYTGQVRALHPWLIANSEDIVARFAPEQRRWVNGEIFNSAAINEAYVDLMTSFVERNAPDHPAYFLMAQTCPPNQQCEESQIAPTWSRVPVGLVEKLMPPGTTEVPIPAEPSYMTEGITTNPVGLDDAARINSLRYIEAYRRLAALYGTAGQNETAQRMSDRAVAVEAALRGR